MNITITYDLVYLKQNPSGNAARLHKLFEAIVHFVVALVRDIRRRRRSILTHTHTHTHVYAHKCTIVVPREGGSLTIAQDGI